MGEEYIELEDDKNYFKKDLLAYLKTQGLPYSYPTLLDYERKGIIPSPRRQVEGFKIAWRIYTGREIKEIARKLQEKMKGKNGK